MTKTTTIKLSADATVEGRGQLEGFFHDNHYVFIKSESGGQVFYTVDTDGRTVTNLPKAGEIVSTFNRKIATKDLAKVEPDREVMTEEYLVEEFENIDDDEYDNSDAKLTVTSKLGRAVFVALIVTVVVIGAILV